MRYLAIISKAKDNYSGWILDLFGAIMATGKTPQDVAERLARGLTSYAEEVGELPTPKLKQASDEDLQDLFEHQVVWIEPAEQNPVSLELARALEESGLSGAEVARRMNLPRQAVTRMVSPYYWGHSLTSLRRFAEALKLDIEVKLTMASHLSDTDIMASLAVEDTLETRTVEKQEWIRLLLTEAMIKARKSAGLTRNQLAKRLRKTPGWVSKLESANSNPKLESIIEYLTALDADLLLMVRRGKEAFQASKGYWLVDVPEMLETSSMEAPKQLYSFNPPSGTQDYLTRGLLEEAA